MRSLTIILVCLFFLGCDSNDYNCYLNYYRNITYYKIKIDAITPDGIKVDTSGFDIDLEEIDKQARELENCLREIFVENPFIDIETARAQDCRDENFSLKTEFDPNITIKRDCLIVKIAPDWYVSPCSGKYIFPCEMSRKSCEDKGFELTEECPCQCRSIIQNENVIITTPNFYVFRGELARMILGCNNPWFVSIHQCISESERR